MREGRRRPSLSPRSGRRAGGVYAAMREGRRRPSLAGNNVDVAGRRLAAMREGRRRPSLFIPTGGFSIISAPQ